MDNDPDQVEKQINDEREQVMTDIEQGRIPRPPEKRSNGLDAEGGSDHEDNGSEHEDEPERTGAFS